MAHSAGARHLCRFTSRALIRLRIYQCFTDSRGSELKVALL